MSFGFNILDQDERPILFDGTVWPFIFEFMAQRINVQLAKLKQKKPNAFMFIDEPGMQVLFSRHVRVWGAKSETRSGSFLFNH